MKVDYTFRGLYNANEKNIKRIKRVRWFALFVAVFCAGTMVFDLYVGMPIVAAAQAFLAASNLYMVYRDTKLLQKLYKEREELWICGNRWGWDR
jgi:Flp pilus assembly protein TadB